MMRLCLLLVTMFLGRALWPTVGLAADHTEGPSVRQEVTQPNIVVFVSDGHGYADSPVYDPTSPIATPNLLRIAHDGTTYTHAFAASPACASSQHVLHTGSSYRYDPSPNVVDATETSGVADQPTTLSVHLKAMGYRLVMVGTPPRIHGRQFPFEVIGERVRSTGQPRGANDVDLAGWLRHESARDHRPIFLIINDPGTKGDTATHANLGASTIMRGPETAKWPKCDALRAARAEYAGRVVAMDQRLGAAYDAVRRNLSPSSTLFLYTSEHGADLPFGKWNLYDSGIRVPLVTVWQDHVPAGSRMDAMISSADFLPTLVEIAGGTPPSEIEGRSFAGLLRGEGYEHRDLVFSSVGTEETDGVYPSCSVRDRRFKYIRNISPEIEFSTPRRRFARFFGADSSYRNRPSEELYDLLSDPTERRNIAADPAYGENLAELRAQMSLWFSRHGRSTSAR